MTLIALLIVCCLIYIKYYFLFRYVRKRAEIENLKDLEIERLKKEVSCLRKERLMYIYPKRYTSDILENTINDVTSDISNVIREAETRAEIQWRRDQV